MHSFVLRTVLDVLSASFFIAKKKCHAQPRIVDYYSLEEVKNSQASVKVESISTWTGGRSEPQISLSSPSLLRPKKKIWGILSRPRPYFFFQKRWRKRRRPWRPRLAEYLDPLISQKSDSRISALESFALTAPILQCELSILICRIIQAFRSYLREQQASHSQICSSSPELAAGSLLHLGLTSFAVDGQRIVETSKLNAYITQKRCKLVA